MMAAILDFVITSEYDLECKNTRSVLRSARSNISKKNTDLNYTFLGKNISIREKC